MWVLYGVALGILIAPWADANDALPGPGSTP
jgi:hypothetical protein